MKASLRDAWKLIAPYWRSSEWKIALLLLIVVIVMDMGQVYINVRLNDWNNKFYSALQDYQQADYYSLLGTFTILAFVSIIGSVYETYLTQMLTIKWRRWLTNYYLDHWLGKQTYYRLQVEGNPADNPDQRISEDIGQFIDLTLNLSIGILNNVVTVFSFLSILWGMSGAIDLTFGGTSFNVPGYMVWAALLYSVVGTVITRWVGRPLIGLTFQQQKFEADFRFNLVRLREYGESVAFYKGEVAEKSNFVKRFTNVFDNYWQIMRRQKTLGWFTSSYGQAAIIFPYVVAAPLYFAKKGKIGDLTQTADAFGKVQGALSYIIDAYMSIATWRAVVERLKGFTDTIERLETTADLPGTFHPRLVSGHKAVTAEGLNLRLPSGEVLQKDISFNAKPGDTLLIQGPSGSGKSTLLRALAGIWPYAEGKLEMPANVNSMFVPQKPYMPVGTLRQTLVYPHGDIMPDEILIDLLKTCQLGHLAHRLDEIHAWNHILSLGEQQRVAFFRALLLKQDLVFLDEATSALDEPAEEYFYELLRKKLPKAVIVSVGHRQTLKKWHDTVLDLGHGKKKKK